MRDTIISVREVSPCRITRFTVITIQFTGRRISILHFANSCNCAFADIGVGLGGASLRETAENLLFNKSLPLNSYRTSSFSLDADSVTPLIMQTAIGQGNTLVSPMHMALITCAIANDGVLMKPYFIDEVVNDNGDSVKKTEPVAYKRLMSSNEPIFLAN